MYTLRLCRFCAWMSCVVLVVLLAPACTVGGGDGGRQGDDAQGDDDDSGDDSGDDSSDDDASDDSGDDSGDDDTGDDSGDDSGDDDSGDDSDDDTGDDTGDDDTAVCDPPIADFSAAPRAGNAPLAVAFSDESTVQPGCPIPDWSWTFGDGGTSIAQDPAYQYEQGGTYTVSLTVTNEGGQDTRTKTDYIAASCPAPVANFSGTPTSGSVPLTVAFTDQSATYCDGATYLWTFGDGGTSTAASPSHQYATAGYFTVTLTVTTDGGIDAETKTNYVHATCSAPTADFYGSPTSGRKPMEVHFTDSSTSNCPITSRHWTFGDGGSSTETNPGHTYTVLGSYAVSLQVTSDGGTNTKSRTGYVSVADNPLVGAYTGATDGREVFVQGNYAYVANGEDGLLTVVNVSTPSNPTLVRAFGDRSGCGVIVSGTTCYVSDPNLVLGGVHLFNVSNPDNPTYVTSYDQDGWSINEVYVEGSYIYAASGGDSLILNAATGAVVGSVDWNWQGYATKVIKSGSYALFAIGSYGLGIVDVSNPASPTIMKRVSTYDAVGVAQSGRYVYVADQGEGMSVIDTFDWTKVASVGNDFSQDIAVSGNYAYVAGYDGVSVYDISTPTSPAFRSNYYDGGYGYGVFISGSYVYYVGQEIGLEILNKYPTHW